MAERMKAKSSTVDPAQLDKVAAYARDTVSKLGEIIWSTKPESDNVESLTSYMRDYLNSYLDGLDMKYEISFPKDEKNLNMNPELRRNLFLVLKESVHNAAKYS